MSGERDRAAIERETWISIEHKSEKEHRHHVNGDYLCGCHPYSEYPHWFYLCDYHEGFDDGVALFENERAEIERLLAAGDALAEALRVNQGAGPAAAFMSDRALTAWKEVRRG